MMPDYVESPRICYGEDRATFVRVCPKCGRFVKARATITFSYEAGPIPGRWTGTCRKCGRIEMPFEGYI